MRTYKRIVLAALAAAAIAAGAAELTGDPSQWGVAKRGSFDITAGDDEGKNGDVPVVPGLAGSNPDITFGRESSIASSAEGHAKLARESA